MSGRTEKERLITDRDWEKVETEESFRVNSRQRRLCNYRDKEYNKVSSKRSDIQTVNNFGGAERSGGAMQRHNARYEDNASSYYGGLSEIRVETKLSNRY